ncbi:ribosome maturation factor RimP [Neptunomonas phycophila]|uniref:Ribosome maturation factor RimP n=1 Tax=Neptunomonas phycophila TaxID=1572645 RepID=A0AAW7XJ64_9GAMM|nr:MULTISPECIES: ribosome maturation factor RimP [Neptunomonas]MBT3144686.1 ribosome maturation factor RimP [Neptunomonas phycophila]MDN2660826.1 ribosome maturation factor RimP [Neptunomonas sp. CHC150]MDO6453766.1 ribosome maturation factor RimP [Neptunomonas phycophila]MDO6467923.1 ribosome maturation factor RimP [Neptunomonas phycophila]MDO6783967.1 ribosome maturation factor RimP [Neptunomonas phycophila]
MSAKLKKIQEMLEPVVQSLDCSLWGMEYITQGKHSMLRVYIEKEGGVSVDDCAAVSHQISGVLDVEDPISGEYTLEVSSPGMDRPLYTLEQFTEYAGNIVQVKLRIPFEGRRNFKGLLNGTEGEDILLVVDDEEFLLPIDLIDRAQVVPQF